MQFYCFNIYKEDLASIIQKNIQKIIFPCIIIEKDKFNDFGVYYTTFRATCFKSKEDFVYVGKVRIVQKGTYNTILPKKFSELDNSFCSIGQETNYYITVYNFLGEEDALNLLENFNDAIFSNKDLKYLHETDTFKESLLRFSEAKKLYKRGKDGVMQDIRINNGSKEEYIDQAYNLIFECNIQGSFKKHRIELDFSPETYLPHRLHVIIGKNGTGKTKVLSNMSNILAGKKVLPEHGNFLVFDNETKTYQHGQPGFRKVISTTYSPFDNYPESNAFSYVHRSFCDPSKKINLQHLFSVLQHEYIVIKNRKRQNILLDMLTSTRIFKSNDYFECIINFLTNPFNVELSKKFSSGQLFLIITFVNVLANIEYESLVLLDEPDLYLHPDAINNLVREIHVILDKFHSYGIITTHSPFVLQNVPSKYVSVFTRSEEASPVSKLSRECFGASVSSIAEEIFEVNESKKCYLTYLNKMAKELSIEKILELFDDNLSLSAGIYLETLISSKQRRKNEEH